MATLSIFPMLHLSFFFALTTTFPTPGGFSADLTTRTAWECDPTICTPVDPGLNPVIIHPELIPNPKGPKCNPLICDPPGPDFSISELTDDGLSLDLDTGDLGRRSAPDDNGDSTAPEPVTGGWLKVRAADDGSEVAQFDGYDIAQFDGYDKKKPKRDFGLSDVGNDIVIGSKEKAKRGTEEEVSYNGNWVGNGARVERDGTLPIPFDGSDDKGKRGDTTRDKRHWGVGNGVLPDDDVDENGIVIGSKFKEKKDAESVDGTEIGNGIVIGSK